MRGSCFPIEKPVLSERLGPANHSNCQKSFTSGALAAISGGVLTNSPYPRAILLAILALLAVAISSPEAKAQRLIRAPSASIALQPFSLDPAPRARVTRNVAYYSPRAISQGKSRLGSADDDSDDPGFSAPT